MKGVVVPASKNSTSMVTGEGAPLGGSKTIPMSSMAPANPVAAGSKNGAGTPPTGKKLPLAEVIEIRTSTSGETENVCTTAPGT